MKKIMLVLLSTITVYAGSLNAEIKEQAELIFKIPLKKRANYKAPNNSLHSS